MVVSDHDRGAMLPFGDEPNDSRWHPTAEADCKGFKVEGSQHGPRAFLALRHRRFPVLPVEQIADHPSCEAGRSEPARGRLAPGGRLGTEDGAALWATLVPHDDRRVIEAKHGREEEVWWTRSDASC